MLPTARSGRLYFSLPPISGAERIKKEATEIAEKKKTIEIAKQLKRKGIDEKTISESTGLSIEEVEKLRVRKK